MSLDVLAPVLRQLSRSAANEITIGVAAVSDWPEGILEALVKVRIFTAAPAAQSTTCPGCSCCCPMDTLCLDSSDVVVCDKLEDYGIVSLDPNSLKQWRCSRPGLVDFLATELALRPKEVDEGYVRIRLGTSKRLMKPLALEFAATPQLLIGDDRHDISDLLISDGQRICLDWKLLQMLAERAGDTASGGKRYQRSTLKREYRRRQTQERDLDLQVAMNRARRTHPKWNKERCAREVGKAAEFKTVTWQRIMRVTRFRT